VDQSLIERRVDARFPLPPAHVVRATLRPGCTVVLVDISAGGALVRAGRPFRPGARVHLQLVTVARTLVLAGHVLRCAVWALDELEGATYQGALKFEQRCDSFWDSLAPARDRRGGRARR
jgi:hypothetical protein